ncbi:hypothetical protein [Catellatospora sichuanensis]|uniref:hypothetical protein n=1 Tax=Catellatospora sichuanensis TaxID=1969805 RepID=UPI001183E2B4|nr:hypothetical protein [Catellatospora sichuanensis]
MGSRVNYAVIRDGSHTLYFHGGGAGDSLDYLFAPGPDVVLRWIAQLGEQVTGEWLTDPLCTGGVLIDTDRRVLLLFANLLGDYAYRAAVLDAFRRTWPGWEIRWAYDGVADLITYVGGDPAAARVPLDAPRLPRYDGHDPELPLTALVTVAGEQGCRAYGLSPDLADAQPFRAGPALVDWLAAGEPLEWCDEIPGTGLHLDPATRTAGLWSIRPLRGLREAWPALWPGWTLDFWGDAHIRQVALCPDVLDEVPPVLVEPGLRELARRLVDLWPVRSALAEAGLDVDQLYVRDVGGMRAMLDVGLTADELARTVDAVMGR